MSCPEERVSVNRSSQAERTPGDSATPRSNDREEGPPRSTPHRWAEEAAISRLYGGIHFRSDNEAGLALGKKVAQPQSRRTTLPALAALNDSPRDLRVPDLDPVLAMPDRLVRHHERADSAHERERRERRNDKSKRDQGE